MTGSVTEEVLKEPRVTKGDLAGRLNVSRKTIYRMVERGELPEQYSIGNIRFWTETQISKWIGNWVESQNSRLGD